MANIYESLAFYEAPAKEGALFLADQTGRAAESKAQPYEPDVSLPDYETTRREAVQTDPAAPQPAIPVDLDDLMHQLACRLQEEAEVSVREGMIWR